MLILEQQLPNQRQYTMDVNDDIRDVDSGFVRVCTGCPMLQKMMLCVWKRKKILRASDALEQVGVAVGSSAAVAELPDARAELHGTPVAHPALTGGREIERSLTHVQISLVTLLPLIVFNLLLILLM